jgi:ATP-dependent DNA helicase RecQ
LRLAKHEEAQAQQAEPAEPIALRQTTAPEPKTTVTFAKGDTVKVRRYGSGLVAGADAVSVTVEFADGTRRTFQPEFVAPGRASKSRAVAAT